MKPLATLLAALSLLAPIFASAAEPLIVAHRGASHDAPENTLPAFELAWKQGADAIEGDFYLTSDHQIVCIHDRDTKRTATANHVVAHTPLATLRELDVGAWLKPEFKGTRIPTFLEVAATVPANGKFYIEIKCGPEIIPHLAADLKKSGLTDSQAVIISFNQNVIRETRKTLPNLRAYWLSSFAEKSPLKPSIPQAIETCKKLGAHGFSSQADSRLTSADIQAIRDAGLDYHCWTVDQPDTARRFRTLGALSITTNRPAFIRQALRQP